MNDDIIQSFFADYRLWCYANGIPPDTYEVFYNTINKEGTPMIDPEEYRRQNNHTRLGGDKYSHPQSFRMSDEEKREVIRRRTIQPNDEDRAVAEAIRILGGGEK